METVLHQIAYAVATACELATVLVVAIGAVEIVAKAAFAGLGLLRTEVKRGLWVGFAGCILLALEFSLASEMVATAVAPTWDALGHLAAIAAIRTVLSLFLARDMEKFAMQSRKAADE